MSTIEQILAASPAVQHWLRVGCRHHHGIAVALFSLHTEKSCGIGEYTDLLPLLDWCHSLGFDLLQLLPLNDTGNDAAPYSAISALALNPLHLGLASLPHLSEDLILKMMLLEIQRENHRERIVYKKLIPMRERFLREYFQRVGHRLLDSDDYLSYCEKNSSWLLDYALFKALKVRNNWSSWQSWPEELKNSSTAAVQKFRAREQGEINYHCLLQYLCFRQLLEVKARADRLQMLLKGDIPILVSRESADVWSERGLFDLKHTAGAPPDNYSAEGQNWGFPLYNWPAMKCDHFRWWRRRLDYAENFYHLYRIDHVVGFFRIWAIPSGQKGAGGYFLPRESEEWIPHGEELMKMMLHHSPLLPIGEDLGTVPLEVRESLQRLGICGTKVMRWERNWEGDNQFYLPKNYPPLSLTTVSTHDSETLAQWWRDNRVEAADYSSFRGWHYAPKLSYDYRSSYLYDSHHSSSLFHINLLGEYLACFDDMVWANLEDERINVPGVCSERNWSYRLRPTLEQICSREALKNLMFELKG